MRKINHLFKSVVAVTMCFFLFVSFSFVCVNAAEAVTFSLDCEDYLPGNEITAICSVKDVTSIGGFVIKVNVPQEFSFVNDSFVAINETITDANVRFAEQTGILYVVWETSAGKGIKADGDIFKVRFRAVTAVAESYDFPFEVTECYTDDLSPKNIITQTQKGVTKLATNSKITSVIDKINAIGTVKYTDECAQKIIAAEEAYRSLMVAERKAVSNYQKLLDARNAYEELAKKHIEDSEIKAAEAFRKTHKAILSKTVKTLKISDKKSLEKALKEWMELPSNTQKALLIEEKNLLNKLSTRMKELEKIAEDELAEKELKEEAKKYEKQLKKDWKQIFALTTKTVSPAFKQAIENALTEAEGYCLMNSYCEEYLSDEIKFLNSLLEKVKELEEEENQPDVFNAEKFLKHFGYLFEMSVDDITADDIEDIRIAYQLLQLLDAESLSKLSKEAALLDQFMAKADELEQAEQESVEDTDSLISDGTDKVITQIQTVPGGSVYNIQTEETDVNLSATDDSKGIFIRLSIVTLISLLVFVVSLVSYLILKRKDEKGGQIDE
ncbi:MAG: hypothetical protein IJP22_03830 [Clostridia bacterium]|nr:hypothetical protein [Clostridia bacterium]